MSDVKYIENMAYDGMGTGSNEFYSGSTDYVNFLVAQPTSIVTTISNMNIEDDPINSCKKQNAVNCVKPYDVIVKGCRKIGLLGFVPTDLFEISDPGPLLQLYAYKQAATEAIAALQTDHPDCEIIIAMSPVSPAQVRSERGGGSEGRPAHRRKTTCPKLPSQSSLRKAPFAKLPSQSSLRKAPTPHIHV